eukprot:Selendium_serpulae@DN4246_c0_g1_i3.p1
MYIFLSLTKGAAFALLLFAVTCLPDMGLRSAAAGTTACRIVPIGKFGSERSPYATAAPTRPASSRDLRVGAAPSAPLSAKHAETLLNSHRKAATEYFGRRLAEVEVGEPPCETHFVYHEDPSRMGCQPSARRLQESSGTHGEDLDEVLKKNGANFTDIREVITHDDLPPCVGMDAVEVAASCSSSGARCAEMKGVWETIFRDLQKENPSVGLTDESASSWALGLSYCQCRCDALRCSLKAIKQRLKDYLNVSDSASHHVSSCNPKVELWCEDSKAVSDAACQKLAAHATTIHAFAKAEGTASVGRGSESDAETPWARLDTAVKQIPRSCSPSECRPLLKSQEQKGTGSRLNPVTGALRGLLSAVASLSLANL